MYGNRKLLTHDHERMDTLLAEYVAARHAFPGEGAARWRAFSDALRRHAGMEERVLFPAYEASVRPGPGGPLDELRRQHVVILGLLDGLDRGAWEGAARAARENELMDVLWDHEQREEGLFLPWMRACLSEDERRLLNERMDADQAPRGAKTSNG